MVAWMTALLVVLTTNSAFAQEMNGEQARRSSLVNYSLLPASMVRMGRVGSTLMVLSSVTSNRTAHDQSSR